jgi:hypothetical protein
LGVVFPYFDVVGDEVAVGVGGDEEGGIAEGFAVEEELLVGFVEVVVSAFVFPDEFVFVPDVGTAAIAAYFIGGGFEGEEFAVGVGVEGSRVADELADVEEVGLGGGDFFELDLAPFGDELLWSHG